MKLSFSTVWADGDINRILHLLPSIDGLEIGSRGHRDFFLELEGLVREGKKRVTSIHAVACPGKERNEADYNPAFASLDGQKRRIEIEKISATAGWALKLGTRCVVIHAGEVEDKRLKEIFTAYRQNVLRGEQSEEREALFHEIITRRERLSGEYLEAAIEGLSELCRRFPGVTFCIETRAHFHEIPTQQELEIIFRRLPFPNLAYWHDIGHTYMLDRLGFMPMERWQRLFHDRCAGVHVHDADNNLNDHYPPGEGVLELASILPSFDSGCYITLEINPRHGPESVQRGIDFLNGDHYLPG